MNREDIMDLPQAFSPSGQPLYYGLEGCRRENIAIWWEGDKGWCRGDGRMRYRVISTGTDFIGPFPRLDSGREQQD